MQRRRLCWYLSVALVSLISGIGSSAEEANIPALDGVEIDGALAEWGATPVLGHWNQDDRIIWGLASFEGRDDLGGRCWMGWDAQFLYIAADVVDDAHYQLETGENAWRGDNVQLMLDADRQADIETVYFDADDFQIALSPGSLSDAGDFLSRRAPEAHVYRPQYVAAAAITVAARKTPTGYTLEAAVPWAFLGLEPASGHVIGFDLCPSDTDSNETIQESMGSLIPGPWTIHKTDRMLKGRLTGNPVSQPEASETARVVHLVRDEIVLQPGEERAFSFTPPEGTERLKPVVSLQARAVFKQLAGACSGLVVHVNGKRAPFDHVLDRPKAAAFASGNVQSLYYANSWTLFYSPDYGAIHKDTSSTYYMPPGAFDAHRYTFEANGLLEEGESTLAVGFTPHPSVTTPMAFQNVTVRWLSDVQIAKLRTDAGGGRLSGPVQVKPPESLALPRQPRLTHGGAVRFSAIGKEWLIESQFSEPGGAFRTLGASADDGWVEPPRVSGTTATVKTARFRLTRELAVLPECFEVRERIENLTGDPQPIIVRHILGWPQGQVANLTINGRQRIIKRGISQNSMNPTLFVEHVDGGGLALTPVDDVFRLHHRAFFLDDKAGLTDDSLVLAPHAHYEQVWQVYAVPSGGYWDMVNAIRRTWDVNFAIPGPFVFLDPRRAQHHMRMTPEAMGVWLDKRATAQAAIMMYHSVTGAPLHGLQFKLEGEFLSDLRKLVGTVREGSPDVSVLHYFHCFIVGASAASEADARDSMLGQTGDQVSYAGSEAWPIFVPTSTNRFGRQMGAQVEEMVEKLDLDGIYWDEQQYSDRQYHYGAPWDGRSGIIDPQTHELVRKRSHVALLSAEWRHALMQSLEGRGLFLICNSPPMTRSEMRFKVPRFVETGSITNLLDTHLFSPMGLGDHHTERSHADTVRLQMEFLDNGCLYCYYGPKIPVENPGLVRWMYPITPIAIGPGFILGQERILTTRGGRFTWGDASLPAVDVHVMNDVGQEVEAGYRTDHEDGVEWLELELPEDHAAAIVRRQ